MTHSNLGAIVLALTIACLAIGTQGAKFRGVNIGGWLVLESWIKPSLYEQNGVDAGKGEWEFCAKLGKQAAAKVLHDHWDTWLLETDLQELAASGVSHIRIPVGYWIVDIQDDEPYIDGGWDYLVRGISWAKKYGLKVLVDLHGAPGSQNGFDNSGRSDIGVQWHTGNNVNRTVNILAALTTRVLQLEDDPTTSETVTGIELLNEPKTSWAGGPYTPDFLRAFYQTAADTVRSAGWQGDIVMHDGFAYEDPGWNGFLAPPQYQNIYIDTHIYHCFGGPRQAGSLQANIQFTCVNDVPMLAQRTQSDWTIVGEWSLATGNDETDFNLLLDFAAAQMEAYGGTGPDSATGPAKGWYFWSFKMESGYKEWSYLDGLRQGFMPNVLEGVGNFSCSS